VWWHILPDTQEAEFKTSSGKVRRILSQKQKYKQKGWGHDSSGRELAYNGLGTRLIPSTTISQSTINQYKNWLKMQFSGRVLA
jgi:hypothetical protein